MLPLFLCIWYSFHWKKTCFNLSHYEILLAVLRPQDKVTLNPWNHLCWKIAQHQFTVVDFKQGGKQDRQSNKGTQTVENNWTLSCTVLERNCWSAQLLPRHMLCIPWNHHGSILLLIKHFLMRIHSWHLYFIVFLTNHPGLHTSFPTLCNLKEIMEASSSD